MNPLGTESAGRFDSHLYWGRGMADQKPKPDSSGNPVTNSRKSQTEISKSPPDIRKSPGTVDAAVGDTSVAVGGQAAASLTNFGRYRVIRPLGEGGMGMVYLAEDTQLKRQVALKIPQLGGKRDGKRLERFYREARLAATLSHPNICQIHDVGELEGTHFISMAYVQGKPLSDLLKPGKPVPERTAASLIRKIALALQEAHAHEVIHRDLKPANIMIDQRGEPIVMDFGLARQSNSPDQVQITHAGAILGTPAYMSPEQVSGKAGVVGAPADIYALGVILYQMLAGRLPFEGAVVSVLAQIATQTASPPSTHRPNLNPQLEAICLKAMARDPADRYPSMKEFAAALADFLRTPKPANQEATTSESLFAELAQLKTESSSVTDTYRMRAGDSRIGILKGRVHRRGWLVIACAATVLGVIGLGLHFGMQKNNSKPTSNPRKTAAATIADDDSEEPAGERDGDDVADSKSHGGNDDGLNYVDSESQDVVPVNEPEPKQPTDIPKSEPDAVEVPKANDTVVEPDTPQIDEKAADEVRAELDQAKEGYTHDVGEILDRFFAQQASGARNRRDTSAQEKIEAARKAFETSGTIPGELTPDAKQKIASERTKLERAYDTAITIYRKSNKPDLAKAVEQERDAFKKNAAAVPRTGLDALLVAGSTWAGRRRHTPGQNVPANAPIVPLTLTITSRKGNGFEGYISVDKSTHYRVAGKLLPRDEITFESEKARNNFHQRFWGKLIRGALELNYDGFGVANKFITGKASLSLQK